MKKLLRVLLCLLALFIVVVVCYVAYVLLTYYRLEDNLPLKVDRTEEAGMGAAVYNSQDIYGSVGYV